VRHAVENRIAITGASDHHVSEAIYLDDPEGNGIEIYADRPKEAWARENGRIAMTTERLDVDGLLSTLGERDAGWQGAPEGTVIGHVHLRAGDVERRRNGGTRPGSTRWSITARRRCFSSGGYHHHIGNNIWKSRGAGRARPTGGLSFVEMIDNSATANASPPTRGAARSGSCRGGHRLAPAFPETGVGPSVAADEADQLALDLDPVGAEDAGLIGRVGGLQRNRIALAAQTLQRRLLAIDQRHDDLARIGGGRCG
jgi:hypothetical protein